MDTAACSVNSVSIGCTHGDGSRGRAQPFEHIWLKLMDSPGLLILPSRSRRCTSNADAWEATTLLTLTDLVCRIDRKKDKTERKILDSQERAFWDVHRPVVSLRLSTLDYRQAALSSIRILSFPSCP